MKGFDNTPFTTHEDLHVSYDMGNWELENRNDEEHVPEWRNKDTFYTAVIVIACLLVILWMVLK